MIRRLCCLLMIVLCAVAAVLGLFLGAKTPAQAVYRAVPHGAADASPIVLPRGDVDVNGGDAEELSRLYRVGESISALIIAEREANGYFFYPEDLLTVRGIGEATLNGFRDSLDLSVPDPD